ncbi:19286_t:CDS:2, partial [Cetraspora pellucida]
EPLLPIASLSTGTNAFSSIILNRHSLPSHPYESIILNEPSAVNIVLPNLQDPLSLLYSYLTGTNTQAQEFCQKICTYNAALAFTSIRAKIDNCITEMREHSLYVQIYVYDMDNEIQNRLNTVSGLDELTLTELQNMLYNINSYAHLSYLDTEKHQEINNNIEDIENSDRAQKYVTIMQYYAYCLQVDRPEEGLSLHLANHHF